MPVPPRVTGMLANACDLFTEGEHRAFSTSDVGPENILINGEGVQFMDYEWGGFRDAILDVAYSQVTCGSVLSAPSQRASDPAVRERLEEALVDAWRAEVALIWPALSNRRVLARRLLAARLLWVWLSTVDAAARRPATHRRRHRRGGDRWHGRPRGCRDGRPRRRGRVAERRERSPA